MQIWTVYLPPDAHDAVGAAENMVLIKEGFCWPALIFGPFWAIWHRFWLVLLALVVVIVSIEAVGLFAGDTASAMLSTLAWIGFAFVANDARRWTLERRGWRFARVVAGGRQADAERNYLEFMNDLPPPAPTAPPSRSSTTRYSAASQAALPGVIGYDIAPRAAS